MVENYYGFAEKPFALTPDPHFFFLSEDHVEALENLLYGISEGEGFLLLSGAIGTGKTTLSRVLIEKLGESVIYSLILNPFQSYFNLLKSIMGDFGIVPEAGSASDLTNQLIGFLTTEVGPRGQTAMIIIDEAQNLDTDTLEQLRILSNIETEKEKLLQILLLGQEELLLKLQDKSLRQLNQRISVRFFLNPLNRREVGQYLQHRIRVSCPQRSVRFDFWAVQEVYRFSQGVPRLINMIAGRSLVAGFVAGSDLITRRMVRRARLSLMGVKNGRGRTCPEPGDDRREPVAPADPECVADTRSLEGG
jgi:general secretion pathway protein A